MTDKSISPEEKAMRLFMRLRQLNFDHCPSISGLISPAQMTLLDEIAKDPGCGVQDIADHLGISPPTVSVGVSKLEESGLVIRKPNPEDGRSVQFFPTARGENLHEKFQRSRIRKFRRLLSGLTSQEQEKMLQLLEKALNNTELSE
ncbi:MarR family winged helix-turn-helix transcriptional regulator [Vibrio sp.]|uniref:MarR family winged helix-turn-helix transcriptional regulator n=1 Tax=Vibrio sp. TaxID=678 RepID=UPI003D0C6B9B